METGSICSLCYTFVNCQNSVIWSVEKRLEVNWKLCIGGSRPVRLSVGS